MKEKTTGPVTISNNTFTGVQWDEKATAAVQIVAEGLLVNAQALRNLTEVFHAQNITIECMLKVNTSEE